MQLDDTPPSLTTCWIYYVLIMPIPVYRVGASRCCPQWLWQWEWKWVGDKTNRTSTLTNHTHTHSRNPLSLIPGETLSVVVRSLHVPTLDELAGVWYY